MHKHVVRVSAPTKYLATYEMGFENGQRRHKRGIHALVFDTVATKINLSYTLQPCSKFGNVPEGASGVLLGNGTWAGCMGDVVRGISDIALSVSPDDKRFQAVHFTSAMEYTYVTYTTSKPGLYYSWRTVFTALNKQIWICFVASLFTTSVTIHLLDQFLEYGEPWRSNASISRFIATLIYLMGYIVGQAVPTPKSSPSKLAYLSWLFYGILIGAVYSSSLQSKIVSPGLDFIPKTFSQLVHSQYQWGAASAFRDGLGEQLFKNSNNPIMRSIYKKMEGDKSEIACTRKALSRYACFNWEMMQRFHLVTEFADKSGNHPFQMATDTAFFVSLNFITRKRELYRSHFSNFMSRSFDSGLVKQTVAMDWRKYRLGVVKARRQGKMEDVSQPVGVEGPQAFKLDNVKGCYILLLCGLTTGSIFFLLERINDIMSDKNF